MLKEQHSFSVFSPEFSWVSLCHALCHNGGGQFPQAWQPVTHVQAWQHDRKEWPTTIATPTGVGTKRFRWGSCLQYMDRFFYQARFFKLAPKSHNRSFLCQNSRSNLRWTLWAPESIPCFMLAERNHRWEILKNRIRPESFIRALIPRYNRQVCHISELRAAKINLAWYDLWKHFCISFAQQGWSMKMGVELTKFNL